MGKNTLIINTKDGQVLKSVDGKTLAVVPPMPVMPVMPELPPVPAVPAIAPVPALPAPLFGDYDSEEAFEQAMEEWGAKMEDWGDRMSDSFDEEWETKMEAWGAEVEARFEGDWETQMEAWGEEMEVWGDGKQTRSFLYIDDCIEATLKLFNSKFHGPINIGSEEKVSINEMIDKIEKISNTIKNVI